MLKSRLYVVGLACCAVVLVGCQGNNQATPATTSQSAGSAYTSKTLTASYSGALNASNQLMLGMLRLEGTDNAIKTQQASVLLPVLQSLQGQALKSDAERNAALAYVEAQLTPAQLDAIVSMHLTQDDLQAWMRGNGPGPGAGPAPGGAGPQGVPSAGPGPGGPRPQGTPGTPPAFRGTPPASGGTGRVGAPSGQSNILLNALLRLLAQRAG